MLGMKVLEERKSKFNKNIKVVKSLGLGTYIQIEGLTQSGGIVEVIWKKTLKKLEKKYSEIKTCLILGLGGGTVGKLVKKYWPEVEITGVEIDPLMVELGEKYLNLKGVKVVLEDAGEFIRKNKKVFDLVIVDLYVGDEFPQKFEEVNFLKRLTKNKIVVFNRLYYGEKRKEAVRFGNRLEKIFKKVEWIYPEANLMFICEEPVQVLNQ